MPKLKAMFIQLDRPGAVYFAGETISGTCVVDCNHPISCREVRLKIHGEASVSFSGIDTSGTEEDRKEEVITYSAEEVYVDSITSLLNKSMTKGGKDPVLPVGVTTFKWTYTLLGTLPSSFEGRDGRVRYYVSCTIDRPSKLDKTSKRPISVVACSDLNKDMRAAKTLTLNNSKNIRGWCWSSGTINCQAEINKQGFVPGENIVISAEIENNSDRKINLTKAVLHQKIKYHGYSNNTGNYEERQQDRVVCEFKKEGIGAKDSQSWRSELVRIPPVTPTNMGGRCGIIHVSYQLDFLVDPSWGIAMHTEFPVLIGTIPLVQGTFAQAPPNLQNFEEPSAPVGSAFASSITTPTAPPPPPHTAQYPEMPPPSYDECVFGSVETKEDGDNGGNVGVTKFAPKYPCYNFQ